MRPLNSLQVIINYEYLLLSGVDVSQPDVDQVPGGQGRLHPGEPRYVWDLWWGDRHDV